MSNTPPFDVNVAAGDLSDVFAFDERTALLAQRLGRLTADQRKKLPTAVRLLELLSEVEPQ